MSRIFLNFAAIALLACTVGGKAQAKTVWHYPYKGTPYATQTVEPFTNLAAIALLACTAGGKAQAKTVWHYPYKGTPYATQTVEPSKVAPIRGVLKKCAKRTPIGVKRAGEQ